MKFYEFCIYVSKKVWTSFWDIVKWAISNLQLDHRVLYKRNFNLNDENNIMFQISSQDTDVTPP